MTGALMLAACGTATPTPDAATLPPDTATPSPPTEPDTATPPPPPASPTPEPPTATPTQAATATPIVPPTPDPNEGLGNLIYSDKLDGTGGWLWTYEDDAVKFGVSREQSRLNGVAKRSGTWRFTISDDAIRVGDQQLRVTALTEVCAENDEYAVLFRGRVDAATTTYSYYAFKLRCGGAARLERLDGPDTSVIVNWTASPAIKAGAGQENVLLVWANKGEMRFYVNDQYLFSTQDTALTEGFYGFYLQDRTNGNLAVSWQNLEARSVSVP
jgi:hypothetical protein